MTENTQNRQQVSDTMSERPMWMRIGYIPFRVRPITLSQIHEMGAIASQIKDIDIDNIEQYKNVNVLSVLIDHYMDADCMRKAALVIMFRSRFMRWLFRGFIFHRLRISQFQKLMNYTAKSFDANFFLTSIIFLRRTTLMTSPSRTTALGQ